jgi:hypothetical protein
MGRLYVFLLVIAGGVCALLLSPRGASADSLTGAVGFTYLYPNTSTTLLADAIGVGSSLSCPGASSVCVVYMPQNVIFSVGLSAISYTASGSPAVYGAPPSVTFNGFDFTGLTFLDGESLTGFELTTDIAGLSNSDVTFGPAFIEINMLGLPVNGDFTLNLISTSAGAAVPEPSSLALLGTGLLALVGFMLRKAMA